MMPAAFQYTGQDYNEKVLCYDERITTFPVLSKALPADFEVRMDEYQPRLDRVGSAARKIFVADGTRYLDQYNDLDFDIAPIPTWFGAFTSPGGWWAGCQAYGVRENSRNWGGTPVPVGSESGGQNLGLSYRHGMQRGVPSGDVHDNVGTINALFYDGHVARMTDQQSREVSYWYPKGGIVQTPAEGMTDVPEGYVIP
jgi:prepilin-type processing-associated H-X9-DG protein